MVSKDVKIKNLTGLDLGPAGKLCDAAGMYRSAVKYKYDDGMANAKSILSILASSVNCGDEITLICDGPDEEQALFGVLQAIESGLGE